MLNDFISLFFPNYCATCQHTLIKGEQVICLKCDHAIPKTCTHKSGDDFVAKKFYGKIKLDHVLAYYLFEKDGLVQKLLHKLKYKNQPEIGVYIGLRYGKLLFQSGFQDKFDIIIPVPLHKKKLKIRGYNQSSKFAEGLSIALNIPFDEQYLIRVMNTSTQTKKSRLKRWQNVMNVFQNESDLKGMNVLLVDDIITTGSTLESCARELLKSQCKSLSVAAIAAAR